MVMVGCLIVARTTARKIPIALTTRVVTSIAFHDGSVTEVCFISIRSRNSEDANMAEALRNV